ncbi:MAG: 16S rRNA (guanine(527)-N(7))-methyltransferase RsmG [Burkholderiales bacterium]
MSALKMLPHQPLPLKPVSPEPAQPIALRALLDAGARRLALALTPVQTDQCLDYLALINKWNKVHNLTAIHNPQAMLTHHLLDCLAVVNPLLQRLGTGPLRVLDVGAGAGLPGVVLAITCPQLKVICVDAVAKKAAFVQQAAATLGLPNLSGTHARVEQWRGAPVDVVTSRAFASLADMTRLTAFHVKPPDAGHPAGGYWLAMKGRQPDDEIAALPANVRLLAIEKIQVPDLTAERCIVWLKPQRVT